MYDTRPQLHSEDDMCRSCTHCRMLMYASAEPAVPGIAVILFQLLDIKFVA